MIPLIFIFWRNSIIGPAVFLFLQRKRIMEFSLLKFKRKGWIRNIFPFSESDSEEIRNCFGCTIPWITCLKDHFLMRWSIFWKYTVFWSSESFFSWKSLLLAKHRKNHCKERFNRIFRERFSSDKKYLRFSGITKTLERTSEKIIFCFGKPLRGNLTCLGNEPSHRKSSAFEHLPHADQLSCFESECSEREVFQEVHLDVRRSSLYL